MSVWGTILKGAVTGAAGSFGLQEIFGGGEPNIAKQLSSRYGCQILQADAPQARALIAKGIDPCSGQQIGDMTASYPSVPRSVLETPVGNGRPVPAPAGPGGAVAMAAGGGALEYTQTGLIRNVITPARRRVSRRKAAAFIRKHGYELSMRAFGLDMTRLAQVVLADANRPRRRKGLSYRQIANARRVYNTVKRMSQQLGTTTTRRAPSRSRSRASASCR